MESSSPANRGVTFPSTKAALCSNAISRSISECHFCKAWQDRLPVAALSNLWKSFNFRLSHTTLELVKKRNADKSAANWDMKIAVMMPVIMAKAASPHVQATDFLCCFILAGESISFLE